MKTLSADLIIAKNQLYSDEPWIMLFELELDDNEYLRLAAYPDRIIWDDKDWTPFPCVVEGITEESSGRRDTVQVHVANVDRMISAYVENNDLLGKTVTLYIVYREHLEVTDDILSFSFRINRIELCATTATFQLGHEDLFNMVLGHQRYCRDKCRFVFRDACCNYPNDDFAEDMPLNLKAGGDGEKGRGWYTTNSAAASTVEIASGELCITPTSGGPWINVTAPFVYKTIPGDFDAYTLHTSGPSNTTSALLVVRSDTTATYWFGLGSEFRGSETRLVLKVATGSTPIIYDLSTYIPYWRITRTNIDWKFYAKTDWSEWSEVWSAQSTLFGNTVRVGFMAEIASSDAGVAQTWEYFKVTTGGLATCDYTLDGPNGCRAHNNTINFGGFPSIPYGRLYA
jgi:phage-related protein